MNRIIDILLWPYWKITNYFSFRKRMKELRKRDPFIYK
jgi:hypothetical protein